VISRTISGALALSALIVGCQSSGGVAFHGQSRSPLSAASVTELLTIPPGARRLGRVSASCASLDLSREFRAAKLIDLDCSHMRLLRALRDVAAARGGNVLTDLSCDGGERLRCSAWVARSEPAPPSASADIADASGALGAEIEVRLSLLRHTKPHAELGSARDVALVQDFPRLPVSHSVVGALETSCAACDTQALRSALLFAAARLGGADLVETHCSVLGGASCRAELALPEVQPCQSNCTGTAMASSKLSRTGQ